jgi:hypothetical protein
VGAGLALPPPVQLTVAQGDSQGVPVVCPLGREAEASSHRLAQAKLGPALPLLALGAVALLTSPPRQILREGVPLVPLPARPRSATLGKPAHRSQAAFPLPRLTSAGVRVPFFGGSHSAAMAGYCDSQTFSPLVLGTASFLALREHSIERNFIQP